MSHAQELINAIQSCNPDRLRAVIRQLHQLADDEVAHLKDADKLWSKKNYINDRLPGGLDLTAIHLATKAYASHRQDPKLAAVFNEMVGDLLKAGASPFMTMGAKRKQGANGVCTIERGQTAIEVCEGHLPPSLASYIIESVPRDNAGFNHARHTITRKQRAAEIDAWRTRKKARVAASTQGLTWEEEEPITAASW